MHANGGLPPANNDKSDSCVPAPLVRRLFADALAEVSEWMKQPNNADELVVLLFDDQPNLAEWKKLPQMLEQVGGALAHFLALCQTHSCSCWGKQPCVRTAVSTDRRSLLLPAHVRAHAVTDLAALSL